jgi:hypothetical protein
VTDIVTNEPNSNPSTWTVRYPNTGNHCGVRRNLAYATTEDQERLMDLYTPVGGDGATGVVIIATGYPSSGLRHHFQRTARQFGAARSWGELFASHGMAAIAYDAVDPITDLSMLIDHVRQHAASLRIDASRLGLFSCSGNTPVALANLHIDVKCMTMLYGFTFDAPAGDTVARAARQFGFANPNSQDAIDTIPLSVRMLIVRAGQDAFTGLNAAIDSFVAGALERNLPITLINHTRATHAFDLLDDGEQTRRIVRDVVQFMKDELTG